MLTLRNVWDAVEVGDKQTVAAALAQSGGAALNIGGGTTGAWFVLACRRGHANIVNFMVGLKNERAVDVRADNEFAFRVACTRGHTKVVALLLGLTGARAIDVHAGNEEAFRMACIQRQTGAVRLLLRLCGRRTIDVHADSNRAVRHACAWGDADTMTLLLAHRKVNGAPVAATLRQRRMWGYANDAGRHHALAERPVWLAAVRRCGAMAARAVRRRRSQAAGAQYSGSIR